METKGASEQGEQLTDYPYRAVTGELVPDGCLEACFQHGGEIVRGNARGTGALFVLSVLGLFMFGFASANVNAVKPGQWSGGAGVGFLGSTPDGAAEFAVNGHAEYFLTRRFSVGPLAQYAGAGNDFLFGLSAQAKYWWDIPGSHNAAKLVVQSGIGFVRAGIKATELGGAANTYTSFLIPVGLGLDYPVTEHVAISADVLLNFTSLGETVLAGGRERDFHTNVMPGLYLGVRF